ncbi:MAG: leucyl aminopeptidase [Gammaproteobacteria bacterium]|nr:MAG: leucyl aminopeptidase [Gammaproteobacteria bacterium]
MRFHVTTGGATAQRTDCLMLPVYQGGPLTAAVKAADRVLGGTLAALIDSEDFRGKAGDTLLLPAAGDLPFRRVLLVGCGPRKDFDRQQLRKALSAAFGAWRKTRLKRAACFLTLERARGSDAARRARIAAEVWHASAYRFTAMKSADEEPSPAASELTIACRGNEAAAARRGLAQGDAIGQGQNLARELGNLPGNICTPSYLAQQARRLARGDRRLQLQVLDEADMRKLGMGALLSVTAGTKEPAKFIVLRYRGAAQNKAPVVLVGKGITFDAGGISLKPPPQMDEMKYDMCGAATVLGVMQAVKLLGAKLNLVGIIPSCENLPSGTATKPGDIVTSMAGKTIEILNTDAEGRLILCDALTYAKRFKPAAIIDIATLTGACLIALGRYRSGLLANSDRLARRLEKAGELADDPVWRLPIDPPYQEQLKSNFADFANVGGRDAGTITAGCFLSRFTEDQQWAHLDIAGTAWQQGPQKGGTGRPVPLLMEFLLNG